MVGTQKNQIVTPQNFIQNGSPVPCKHNDTKMRLESCGSGQKRCDVGVYQLKSLTENNGRIWMLTKSPTEC